jgi:diguanylate cyclase (GGDEF)-like protein/PAS domain S-box-containing protein
MAELKQKLEFRTLGIFPVQPQKAHGAVLAILSNVSEHPLLHTDEQQLIDELIGDLAFALDLALQQEIQQQTLQELKLAATVFANSIEAIIVTDADTGIISVNRAFSEITGYAESEAIGQIPSMLKSDYHPATFFKDMWQELNQNGRWRGEIWNRRKNGQVYPASLSIACVYDSSGIVSNYIGIFNDISQIKESEQQLHYLQFHDPLSDLPNRSMFSEMLTKAIKIAQERDEHLALLCLDLDHFKDINDSYGFPAGDAILQQMARRLDESISSSDKIARLGADEFVVLLERVENDQEVSRVAEKILYMMEEPFVLESGDRIQISTSIGMALYPQHGETSLELLQKVDSAVYLSKQRGRNRFSFYNEENTARAVERLELSNHLRHALEYDELKIHYQPQVNIRTGNIIGAEALMRWDSPTLGMVPPDRFIPLAEQLGCIIPMGEWILRRVCAQGRSWLDAGMPEMNLAVNLSAIQFYQEDIVEVVQRILADTGFPAEHLELEVTESLLMHKERQTITRLQKLKELGVRLAMDDFGTGYSSLAYLKFFPLDVLKIDKSFVDDLPHGQADRKMVSAISQMGHGLGLTLLAEGVENLDQLDYLQTAGCTLYQGYLCSRPVPADEFIALVLSLNTQKSTEDTFS